MPASLTRGAIGLALVGAAGCLSRPTGLPDDVEPDASEATWPVAGATIDRSRAIDIDRDGDLDLIVTSVADGPTRGVYVLAGGDGFGAAYQEFMPTPFTPLSADVADMGDTTAPELAILGPGPGGVARVVLHAGVGPIDFFEDGWTKDFADLSPELDDRRNLRLFDSDGDGRVNVVVNDNNRLFIAEPATFDEDGFFSMTPVQVQGRNSDFFIGPGDCLALPAAAGRADLVVDDFHVVSVFRGDGTDTYLGTARTDVDVPTDQMNAAYPVDLDGDDVPEFVGVQNGGFLGATSLVGLGGQLDYQGPNPGAHAVGDYVVLRVAELDGAPGDRPDLLLVEHFAEAGPVTDTDLVFIGNLVATAGTPGTLDPIDDVAVHHPIPGLAAGVEVGDFDGDGDNEIIVVGADGAITCLQAGDGELVACD